MMLSRKAANLSCEVLLHTLLPRNAKLRQDFFENPIFLGGDALANDLNLLPQASSSKDLRHGEEENRRELVGAVHPNRLGD
jgi:hypothetical protein